MALITQATAEELVQLKARAEVDIDLLINQYHQVCSLLFCQVMVVHLKSCMQVEVYTFCWPASQPAYARVNKGSLHVRGCTLHE